MKTFTKFILEQDEQIAIDEFPFELEDIISCETQHLGPCTTPEAIAHIKLAQKTAKILGVVKAFGYGSDFKKSTPDDFIYEVTVEYMEKALDEIPNSRLIQRPYFANPGERTYKNRMLIGVNQEGKSSVFMN